MPAGLWRNRKELEGLCATAEQFTIIVWTPAAWPHNLVADSFERKITVFYKPWLNRKASLKK
jgi:hypothetical protein